MLLVITYLHWTILVYERQVKNAFVDRFSHVYHFDSCLHTYKHKPQSKLLFNLTVAFFTMFTVITRQTGQLITNFQFPLNNVAICNLDYLYKNLANSTWSSPLTRVRFNFYLWTTKLGFGFRGLRRNSSRGNKSSYS